ncbi:MAG: hypothetical protein OEZ36_08340 [Spirochaetota bacterium]|nr:hypothetical protein [Spirochaetota bacterium]
MHHDLLTHRGKAFFRPINIFFISLSVTQVTVMAVAYYLINIEHYETSLAHLNMFKFLVPLVIVSSLFINYTIIPRQIARISHKPSLDHRLMSWRTMALLRLAPYEGANLLCAIAYLLTGNKLFIIVFLVTFLLFLLNKPGIARLSKELNLSHQDLKELLQELD